MSTNFRPTARELALVSRIFQHANCHTELTGDTALEIFCETELSPAVLSHIWGLADEKSCGSLSEKGVAVAIRLMGWAQNGEEITEALLDTPGPLPVIKGISPLEHEIVPSQGFPPVAIEDLRKSRSLFLSSGPSSNGLLNADKARDIFLQSNLSAEDLWQIWNLVDTQKRGALDCSDFALGMYLIQASESGQLLSIPTSIPPQLLQVVSEESFNESHTPSTPSSSKPRPKVSKPHSSPSMSNSRHKDHTPTVPSSPTEDDTHDRSWDITPSEKLNSDLLFDSLDTEKRGFLEGDVAAKYLLKSKLSPNDLALVWDLSDLNNDNYLTRDGFAIAVHLIQRKLAGVDVPSDLPPSLIPPSMRASRHSSDTQKNEVDTEMRYSPQVPHRLSAQKLRIEAPNGHPFPLLSLSPHTPSTSNSPATSWGVPPPPLARQKTHHSLTRRPSFKGGNDSIEDLKRENALLVAAVEQSSRQMQSLQEQEKINEHLKQQNEALITLMGDMERSMRSLLSIGDQNETLTQEIGRLETQVKELVPVKTELEETSRQLDEASKEKRRLTVRTQEMKTTILSLTSDSEELRTQLENRRQENEALQTRVKEMERLINQPQSSGSRRELQMLLSKATQENEQLKLQTRKMQHSMTQLLLADRGEHGPSDGLKRENKRLTLQVRELEHVVMQLQASVGESEIQRVMAGVVQENESLKAQVREMTQSMTSLPSPARVEDLQRQIEGLTVENRHLKAQMNSLSSQHLHEDHAVPPPAYDDNFTPVAVS